MGVSSRCREGDGWDVAGVLDVEDGDEEDEEGTLTCADFYTGQPEAGWWGCWDKRVWMEGIGAAVFCVVPGPPNLVHSQSDVTRRSRSLHSRSIPGRSPAPFACQSRPVRSISAPASSASGFRAHPACARPPTVCCVPVELVAISASARPKGGRERCFERRTARHARAAYHIIRPPFEITFRTDYHLRSCARFSLASCLL